LAIVGSLLITFIAWNQFLISVWCFFAALLSIFVLMFVGKKH